MLYMDVQAETIDAAKKKAVALLKLDEKELSFEVLEKGKPSFLGLGKSVAAVVRVFYKQAVHANDDDGEAGADKKSDIKEHEKEHVDEVGYERMAEVATVTSENGEEWASFYENIKSLVSYLDGMAEVESFLEDGGRYKVLIKSDNVSHIIGKQGKALAALQTVVNAILQKYENRFKVIIDIDYYNRKKDQQLLSWVNQQVKKVVREKRAIVLKSLNSYERRLIHLEVKNHQEIIVESKGEGKIKNMKISPGK